MSKNNDANLLLDIAGVNEKNNELISINSQKTAKKAIKILVSKDPHIYKDLTAEEKKNLIIAFAMKGKIIYGKAFDVIKIKNKNEKIDFFNQAEILKKLNNIIVCEIKSTNKKTKKQNFEGYFFGLTTAELLVAQNLKENYNFIFVNINTEEILELTLKQIFEKAKGIYPQWSISF